MLVSTFFLPSYIPFFGADLTFALFAITSEADEYLDKSSFSTFGLGGSIIIKIILISKPKGSGVYGAKAF